MANENPQAAADTVLPEKELTNTEKAYFESGGEARPEAPDPENNGAAAQAGADGAQDQDASADAGDDDQGQGQEQAQDARRGSPKQALRAERQRNKELEDRLKSKDREIEDFKRQTNERFAQMQAMLQPKPQPAPQEAVEPPKVPRVEEDMFGAMQWMQDQILTQRQREEKAQEERQKQMQARQFEGRVMQEWQRSAVEAVQADPTFGDAYEFVTAQRFHELVASGATPEQAAMQARRDEFAIVAQALRDRVNPAARVKAVAAARGWAPKPPEQQQQAQQQSEDQGQRLDAIAEAQRLNKTISGSGAAAPSRGQINGRALAEMSDAEYKAWFAKNGTEGWHAAMNR